MDENLCEVRDTKKPENQGLSGFLIEFETLKADRTGLEPATSAVTGQHSNQLNYRSGSIGFEI
jgi:hypothetical protein